MKTIKKLPLLIVVCLLSLGGLFIASHASAATYTTKAECASNVLTVTATAPSSVTTNGSFTISGISSTSTAPAGFTINKIVSTTSVTNGSPASMSGTWTGAGTGTFTAHFPDSTVTATGAAGTQVSISLSSIDLYINGGSTPITCSKANNQLTANKPGESLTMLSMPITAPASTPTTPTSTPTSTAPTTSNTTTKPTTTAPATTTKPTAATPTPTNATTTTPVAPQTKDVTITVVDASGKPASNVPVKIDDSPPVNTNAQGMVTFQNVTPGNHKVAVLGKKTSVTKTLNVSEGSEAASMKIQLPRQAISPILLGAVGVGALLIVTTGIVAFLKYRKRNAWTTRHIATSASGMPVTSTTVTSAPPSVEKVVLPPAPETAQPITQPPAISPTPEPTSSVVELAPAVQVVQPQPVAEQPAVSTQPIAVQPPAYQTPAAASTLTAAQEQYLANHHATVQPGNVIAPQAPSQT